MAMNDNSQEGIARQRFGANGGGFYSPLLILTAVRSAIADWNDVPSGSMNPTIVEGDRVFVNKLAYDLKIPFTTWHIAQWSNPKRGDIVVFFSPADGIRLVKRVIGLPGDRIEMVNDKLFINGVAAHYEPLPASVGSDLPSTRLGPRIFADENGSEMPDPCGDDFAASSGKADLWADRRAAGALFYDGGQPRRQQRFALLGHGGTRAHRRTRYDGNDVPGS